VGADEIDKSQGQPASVDAVAPPITPLGILEKMLREKYGIDSFEDFKGLLRDLWKQEKYRNESAKSWNSFQDIDGAEARKLLAVLNHD
jgi:hypothetical protein